MLAILLLLQSPSADVVVTGKRLAEAHAACVRGGCMPLRDAQASVAFAEAQFLKGDYYAAKRTLAAAVARNRARAKMDPKPVAALYEAYATVLLHDGDVERYRRAAMMQLRTLRDNLPADDPAALDALLVRGDMLIALGDHPAAEDAFRSADKRLAELGRGDLAMLAAMKRVWAVAAQGERGRAERMLDELGRRPAATAPGFGLGLRVLRLRITARSGDGAAAEALAREIGQEQGASPALLWSPPFRPDAAAAARRDARRLGEADLVYGESSASPAYQWADIGYWIRPDGRTGEAEVLRGSRSRPWARAVLAQIAGRRYAPRPTGGDDRRGGVYRVERFTQRARYVVLAGSLILRRVPVDGFETLDLTQAAAPPPERETGRPVEADN